MKKADTTYTLLFFHRTTTHVIVLQRKTTKESHFH